SNTNSTAPVLRLGSAADIGDWTFQIDVDDEVGERTTTTWSLHVPTPQPTIAIEGNTSLTAGTPIDLSVSPATDPFGVPLQITWDLVASPPASAHQAQTGFAQ